MVVHKEAKGRLRKALSHPLLGIVAIVGSIASLISIPLALYFYFQAKDFPQLTYYVNPVKAVVVRSDEASRLTASYDGKSITTDITAAQLALWNEGTRSIKKGDVLKPLVIFTENSVPILEATIRKKSRDVTQLELNTEELQKGRVIVSWNILEHADGCVIQVIYAGDTSINIMAEGVIEGQSQVKRLESSIRIKSAEEQFRSVSLDRIFGIVILVMSCFGASLSSYVIVLAKRHSYQSRQWPYWIPLTCTIIFIGYSIYTIARAQVQGPPFGF